MQMTLMEVIARRSEVRDGRWCWSVLSKPISTSQSLMY